MIILVMKMYRIIRVLILKLYMCFVKIRQRKNIILFGKKNWRILCVVKNNRGWNKTPERVNVTNRGNTTNQGEKVGKLIFKNAFRKDSDVFDYENPQMPTKENVGQLCEYDATFFETKERYDIVKEDLSQCAIVRNNQIINYTVLPRFKASYLVQILTVY